MNKHKIDKSSQTQIILFEEENHLVKSYQLRPRRKSLKAKRHLRPGKNVQIYRNLDYHHEIQVNKEQSSSTNLQLPLHPKTPNSDSNRSSTPQSLQSSKSKSSNILIPDEETTNVQKKQKTNIPSSSSLTMIEKSKTNSKLRRPQTCPASLSLRIVHLKLTNSRINKTQTETLALGQEKYRQKPEISLSDVILRQKESHLQTTQQSTSDVNLKSKFPRKRSLRTSLKDVSSSPKTKRKLIENLNKNSRNQEKQNILDFCSGSVEPMSNDSASVAHAFTAVIIKHEKQEGRQDKINPKNLKNNETNTTKDKINKVKMQKHKENLIISSDQGCQDRKEFILDKKINLMTKNFKDDPNVLQDSIVIKKEINSKDLDLNVDTIHSTESKWESAGLSNKGVEIAGTNEDLEKNKQDPEPCVERKVDRFRNLLEKISMLPRDVTILLEDAGRKDKTLEFLRNPRNFSRNFNAEPQEPLKIGENSQTLNIPLKTVQNHLNFENASQPNCQNESIIDEDGEIQILKVIVNRNRSHLHLEEVPEFLVPQITDHLDEDYHFLLSLYHQLRKMPQERKLKMKLKIQQLFCVEI